jgi:hypothetical protein
MAGYISREFPVDVDGQTAVLEVWASVGESTGVLLSVTREDGYDDIVLSPASAVALADTLGQRLAGEFRGADSYGDAVDVSWGADAVLGLVFDDHSLRLSGISAEQVDLIARALRDCDAVLAPMMAA